MTTIKALQSLKIQSTKEISNTRSLQLLKGSFGIVSDKYYYETGLMTYHKGILCKKIEIGHAGKFVFVTKQPMTNRIISLNVCFVNDNQQIRFNPPFNNGDTLFITEDMISQTKLATNMSVPIKQYAKQLNKLFKKEQKDLDIQYMERTGTSIYTQKIPKQFQKPDYNHMMKKLKEYANCEYSPFNFQHDNYCYTYRTLFSNVYNNFGNTYVGENGEDLELVEGLTEERMIETLYHKGKISSNDFRIYKLVMNYKEKLLSSKLNIIINANITTGKHSNQISGEVMYSIHLPEKLKTEHYVEFKDFVDNVINKI